MDTTRPDNNNDGLVDRWQARYGVINANADPHRDELTNVEEMNFGTDPTHADTDRGGETDGSEIDHGRNPLEADDDALFPVMDFWCHSEPGKAILQFNAHPDYDRIRVFRRTLGTPFTLMGEFKPVGGELADQGVTDGVNYLYFIQPLGTGNVRGAYGIRRHCQPDADPYAPDGQVYINNDEYETDSLQVILSIPQMYQEDGTAEITHIKLSNSRDVYNTSKWQAYVHTIPWTIDPDPKTSWAYVYVLLRDAAGNVSEQTVTDGIYYNPPAPLPNHDG